MRTIKYRASYEDMLSRIPGLFAYLEEDEFGVMQLHRATDSPMGCYGKVIENIKIHADVEIPNDLYNESRVVTYKTLIGYYYEHKEGGNSAIINFIEKGIGKVNLLHNEYGLTVDGPFLTEHPLCPSFVYLSQVHELYRRYTVLSKQSLFYNNRKNFDKYDEDCCKAQLYEDMGGDTIRGILGSLLAKVDDIADDYYEYAHSAQSTKPLTLNFNVNMVSSVNDLGLVTPAVRNFVLGENYEPDDVVAVENNGLWSTWKNLQKTSGEWDQGELRLLPEFNKSTKWLNVDVPLYNNQPKIYTEFIIDYNENCILDDNVKVAMIEQADDVLFFNLNGIQYIINQQGGIISWESGNVSIQDDKFILKTVDITSESVLKSLRRYTEYLNVYDEPETPPYGKDWLFYYRKGYICNIRTINDDFGNIVPLKNDGNYNADGMKEVFGEADKVYEHLIETRPHNNPIVDVTTAPLYDNLCAYGDVIEDITADPDKKTITFVYWLDAHLKARLRQQSVDDDDNYYYKFSDFEIDTTSDYGKNHGVKYTETFSYDEGGELDLPINSDIDGVTFDDYIQGNNDVDRYSKYEFRLGGNVRVIKKRVGLYKTITVTDNIANVDIRKSETDNDIRLLPPEVMGGITNNIPNIKLFRHDYYQGISYAPIRDINVSINRGMTSLFEKHIKFSEVHTLEDLEESNFFIMQE